MIEAPNPPRTFVLIDQHDNENYTQIVAAHVAENSGNRHLARDSSYSQCGSNCGNPSEAGVQMDMVFASSQQAYRLRHHSQSGFLKLGYALILAAVVIAVGALVKFGPMTADIANGGQSNAAIGPREVDFGFVELKPGLPTPITSYKFGGNMVLYAGEVVSYQVIGPAPLPAIDFRIGQDVHTLSGADGKLLVAGPANQALPAAVVVQNLRYSLPGGAPPRVSMKVQVQGAARPTK